MKPRCTAIRNYARFLIINIYKMKIYRNRKLSNVNAQEAKRLENTAFSSKRKSGIIWHKQNN